MDPTLIVDALDPRERVYAKALRIASDRVRITFETGASVETAFVPGAADQLHVQDLAGLRRAAAAQLGERPRVRRAQRRREDHEGEGREHQQQGESVHGANVRAADAARESAP